MQKASSSSGSNHKPVIIINIDAYKKYQPMQAFGGFYAKVVYSNSGPFTSLLPANSVVTLYKKN
jgi:hypothetical protein